MGALNHHQALALVRDRSMFNDERWELLGRVCDEQFPPGSVHEFGVAEGGVTGYLALRFPNRHVHAWCRFEKGCTAPVPQDGDSHLHEGCMGGGSTQADIYSWLNELHAHQMVHLIQRDLAEPFPIPAVRIALAVIDVNLYEPTLNVLNYVLPALENGGVILVDDVDYPGVQAALNACGHYWVRDGYMAVLRKRDAEGI